MSLTKLLLTIVFLTIIQCLFINSFEIEKKLYNNNNNNNNNNNKNSTYNIKNNNNNYYHSKIYDNCNKSNIYNNCSSNNNNNNNPNNNNSNNNVYKNDEFLKKNIIPDTIILTRKLHESKNEKLNMFLTFWNEIEDKSYEKTKDIPFTIFIPNIDVKNVLNDKLEEFLLEHILPGFALHNFNEYDIYGNLNKNPMKFTEKYDKLSMKNVWHINDIQILSKELLSENMSIIFIDGYLGDWKNSFSKRNIQEKNSYNEPQRLEMKNVTKHDNVPLKENKINYLMNFLAGMKTGTKVFQHFLSRSNLTQLLNDSTSYTVLIPSDSAFQRWHPIDWGFYPFSVQEFTENILRNHFLLLRTQLKLEDIKNMKNEQKYKTLGGETVVFKNYPTPNVNNVTILSDHTLPNGNEIFIISEVLFVSEAVVSRLHQMNKDKETPPLLAFPWFGAQFLSHSFLALERDSRFTQITRYLNTAEIAPFVSGLNFTFFVPTDKAFEKIGYDSLSDDILASDKGVKLLLNHFVKGRLYDRDLKHDDIFEGLGGGFLKIGRINNIGNITVNNAHIIESEIFVYNLGTMFYIDEILYPEILNDEKSTTSKIQSTFEMDKIDNKNNNRNNRNNNNNNFNNNNNGGAVSHSEFSTQIYEQQQKTPTEHILNKKLIITSTSIPLLHGNNDYKLSTITDVEILPSEFTEQSESGSDDDFLLKDDEVLTPKALPVFDYKLPRK